MTHFTRLASHLRKSIWVGTLGVALLSVAACQGGSSPTEPFSAPIEQSSSTTLSTKLGSLLVVNHGCPGQPNLQKFENELYTTANVAMKQNPSLAVYENFVLNGFELHCRTAEETSQFCGPTGLACFTTEHGVGRLNVWCDGGGVEHETAHALAYATDLSCWRDVYHGINFRCEPV